MKEDQTSDTESLALSKNKPKFKEDPLEKENFGRDVVRSLEQVTASGWLDLSDKSLAKGSKGSIGKISLTTSSKGAVDQPSSKGKESEK